MADWVRHVEYLTCMHMDMGWDEITCTGGHSHMQHMEGDGRTTDGMQMNMAIRHIHECIGCM